MTATWTSSNFPILFLKQLRYTIINRRSGEIKSRNRDRRFLVLIFLKFILSLSISTVYSFSVLPEIYSEKKRR